MASVTTAASESTAKAVVAAAAHLAVFFPLHELLSLTHESVSLADSTHAPEAANHLRPPGAFWVMQLGLTMAQALIAVWSGTKLSQPSLMADLGHNLLCENAGEQGGTMPFAAEYGPDGLQEEESAIWAGILRGLLGVAQAEPLAETNAQDADMLLLRLLSMDIGNAKIRRLDRWHFPR